MKYIEGNIIDVETGLIFPGTVEFDGRIREITPNDKAYSTYICPGFIDPHIHIESTMMTPSMFGASVAPHGTQAVVADPHEIANVLGIRGIEFMLEDARQAPIDIFLCAPSCVPATAFETSGATLGPSDIEQLMSDERFVALGEMMNYPGVVNGDIGCLEKIGVAKRLGKPVDGHCPGLRGSDLERYINAGISTDHECSTLEEAEEKAGLGMKIFIREGSSAKNLKALIGMKGAFSFCTDDRHVEDILSEGHMDHILSLAVEHGKDPVEAIRMVTLNPSLHYSIDGGAIKVAGPANLLVLEDLVSFRPKKVFHHGKMTCRDGKLMDPPVPRPTDIKVMNARKIRPSDLVVPIRKHVIGAMDGELLTEHLTDDGNREHQKIVVVDRHTGGHMSVAYLKGMDMDDCAIAQTIAHDSHNIISTGSGDELISKAVNSLIDMGGGIVACSSDGMVSIRLEVAGLMSGTDPSTLAARMGELKQFLRQHNASMESVVTTLSFMALLVIPHIKLSDLGLFDVDSFRLIENDY